MAKYCQNCGTWLSDGVKFCTECGADVQDQPQNASENKETTYSQVGGGSVNVKVPQMVKKPIYKKWWFWAIIAFFFVIFVANAGSNNTEVSETNNKKTSVESTTDPKIVEAETAVPTQTPDISSQTITVDEFSPIGLWSAFSAISKDNGGRRDDLPSDDFSFDISFDENHKGIILIHDEYDGDIYDTFTWKQTGNNVYAIDSDGYEFVGTYEDGWLYSEYLDLKFIFIRSDNSALMDVIYSPSDPFVGDDSYVEDDYLDALNAIEEKDGDADSFVQKISVGQDGSYIITYTSLTPRLSSWGNYYDAIVEIKNTGNTNLYLATATFDIEDQDGHLLATDDMISSAPEVISPGEKGYFYTNTSSLDDDLTNFDELVLVPSLTVKKATGFPTRLPVEDVSLYESYDSVGVRGRIVNDTDDEVSWMYLKVIFYDSNGEVLGISATNIWGIEANTKTSFECSGIDLPERVTLDSVDSYTVYADEVYFQW